jgi:hypothetical protein
MRSYTVFQFTQRAIENRSTCHAWHACRRLPTPALVYHLLFSFKNRLETPPLTSNFQIIFYMLFSY